MKEAGPKADPDVPTSFASLLRNPDVVALIAYVGAVSREIGYQQAEDAMARRWRAMAAGVQAVLRQPTYAEMQRRRGES